MTSPARSPWKGLGAITVAFLAGSVSLSLLPTKENSFVALADLVSPSAEVSTLAPAAFFDPAVKPVAFYATEKPTGDWPMWGGTPARNNVPVASNIPSHWNVGEFTREGEWIKDDAENIKWVAAVGSQTYGNPVVADGRIYVGTNNGNGYLKRYAANVDLGCLLCFSESDGKFLWQHSSEKLSTGRVHDWPLQGICCAPYVEGTKVWFVSSRGEVICCDTEGFYDDEDDGPTTGEWARLVDVRANEDPALDKVSPARAALQTGKLTDELVNTLAAADVMVKDGTKIAAAGNKFKFEGQIHSHARNIEIRFAGPLLSIFKQVTPDDKEEADVIWKVDMMGPPLNISQHNMCSCSVTALGNVLFVNTSNGLDESHINLPRPDAPSFIALDKETGKILWTDKSPGKNILHGQWSSPSIGTNLGGVNQVIFAGGDGWVYSFKADEGKDGKPELLWKFDANPKSSEWILGGRGTRNNIIATPVVYDEVVYVAVGQDPEHGEGEGHLWCIDPTKRGDVSPELAVNIEDRTKPILHKRLQAIDETKGEVAIANPNSAVIWHYGKFDQNGDGEIEFEEEMHRSCGTVAIKDDILYISDFSGLLHCLDAKTGEVHWTYDMLDQAWGSPLIVDDKVFIGDEGGEITIFELKTEKHDPIAEIDMLNSVYSTPIVANGVLFIANKTHLFAISQD